MGTAKSRVVCGGRGTQAALDTQMWAWLPTGRAQPGPLPAHIGHPVSAQPGHPAGWGTGPCLQPFGRAGQGRQHAGQILSARCAPQAPPCAPVNKLHNEHRSLQNHRWLPAVACAPPGSPSCPGLVLPWAETPSPCRDEPPSQGQQAPEPTQQLMAMWLPCAREGQPGRAHG